MKSTTTGELRNPNIITRARYAFNISLVLTTAFVLGVGISLFLAQSGNISQLYTLSAIGSVSSVLSIFAIRFIRQKRVDIAAYLMIAGVILNILVTSLFISGLGLLLGVTGFVSIFMIATLTLVQPESTRSIISGILLSVAVILLDTFVPFDRLEMRVLTAFVSILAILSIAFFGYYVSQQFSGYPLRNKLILLFITIVFFSVGSVAIVTNILVRDQITQQVGQSQLILANRLAYETGKNIEAQVDKLFAASTQLESIAAESTASYVGSDEEIREEIIQLDQEWISSPNQASLIQNVLTNETANKLREFRNMFPDHAALILTDAYGATIAATNRTTGFYHADEDWWKLAYNLGKGRVFISQPEFDQTSDTYGVLIAIPIFANTEVVGILRSTYTLSAIFNNLEQGATSGTEEFDLRFANDALLDPEEIPGLNTVMGGYGEIQYKGELSLVSEQRVFSSQNSNARAAISDLGWIIIVHKDVDDALQPVREQTRTITIIAAIITALVGALGFYASQRLAAPILTLTGITTKIAEGDLSIRANISTQDEIGELANSFNRMTSQLQDTLGGLERRVAERTADLELARLLSERRAQELQSISEISRAISSEQRLETLLPLITRLVSDRLDFYHVGIFFIDETRRFTYLQAANSHGGQTMLARGHRLEVGVGLVGTVAKTGKPRIALDVGIDASYFDNPDLPETRSEMALPLNAHGKTIGVLDVQSTKPGAFTEADANTLSILGDQVAIAIENARLFDQTQQARDEAEALYSQALRQEWSSFNQLAANIGYHQTSTGGKSIKTPVLTNEIRQTLESGKVVAFEGNGKSSAPSITIPVKLRGQTLGVLNIKAPTSDRKWSQDEINLAQAVSDRLALALDNARLLQESQRSAAKEAKIGEVSAKISASINMRSVLETAVEALGRALPGSEVVLQLEKSEEKG